MQFSDVVRNRRSIKHYNPASPVTDADLGAIFADVVLAPSSFNLQHWTFVVVRDAARKAELRAAAWNQPQVEEAGAVILVCGKLDAWKDAQRLFADFPENLRDSMVSMSRQFYEGRAPLMRDEAIRSGAMAAMMLMLAAQDHGFNTGPMIGFDPDAVSRIIRLDANYIPVMMVVLGQGKGEPWPRPYRRPLAEVVRFETLDGAGLGG